MIDIISRLKDCNVLVVGDVMLDRFVQGDIGRISPEAPVPVLKEKSVSEILGGAGNVVRNLSSLGCRVSFVSSVGPDAVGEKISELLEKMPRVCSQMVIDERRLSTVKTRFLAGQQQVLRVDSESGFTLDEGGNIEIMKYVCAFLGKCSTVVISDYGKGVLSTELTNAIIENCRKTGRLVLVDPKGSDFGKYAGATLITPNLKELGEATQMPVDDDASIALAAGKLISLNGFEGVLVTRSQDGMTLVQKGNRIMHFEADAKEVFDVSGAGDTVIAAMAAGIAAGISFEKAAALSNVAAGIVVSKVGTAVVHPEEIINAVHQRDVSNARERVVNLVTAAERVEKWRRRGLKIGFTNGFFEILRPFHVHMISQAAKKCDRLIIGINGDQSVKRVLGRMPLMNESARCSVLASLENVDMIIPFLENDPISLIGSLRPDVLFKGDNYKMADVVGADFVRSYGGEVVLVPISEEFENDGDAVRITGNTF